MTSNLEGDGYFRKIYGSRISVGPDAILFVSKIENF